MHWLKRYRKTPWTCLLYTSAGPSINTQITVVSLVSSLAATLFVKFHLF